MSSDDELVVLFAEAHHLLALTEMALRRRPTPAASDALRYLFGEHALEAATTLLRIADDLGLPPGVSTRTCDAESLPGAAASSDVLVTKAAPVDAPTMERAVTRLRLIQKVGRITDNIDVAAARRFQIPVATLTRATITSCAEHTVALMLLLVRQLLPAHRAVINRFDPTMQPAFSHQSGATQYNWAGLRGITSLNGRTLGLVGFGEFAREVAARARALGLEVLYHKRSPLSAAEHLELDGVEHASLDELLVRSDIVSVHVPHTPGTEQLIDAQAFAAMKESAFFINTSRGAVVDEVALYEALRDRSIAGAALDVYRQEPVPSSCPLLSLDNVVWTPHVAAGDPYLTFDDVRAVLANIKRVHDGRVIEGVLAPPSRHGSVRRSRNAP